MFTGIIQSIGTIVSVEPRNGDATLRIGTGKLDLSTVQTGDSIAVNGVCLTVVEIGTKEFTSDLSSETLSRTTLGDLSVQSLVNLEKALTLSAPLGGHLVSGHVDGLGTIVRMEPDSRSMKIRIRSPKSLARYIAEKGSICVDGVSLTVNAVHQADFEVNLVPHTLSETTLKNLKLQSHVNLEVDLLARYLERLMEGQEKPLGAASISKAFLARYGYDK